jgi:hypothetical protein
LNGGATIIDYRINIAEQGQASTVLVTGHKATSFTAVSLTAGVIYEFTVEARNSYGYSALSSTFTSLTAFTPEAPFPAPITTNDKDEVIINWSEPVSNGSPITSFRVYIM